MSKPGPDWLRKNEARCRSCGAPIIWWVTPAGKRSPHDPDGASHFATCPNAATHRKTAQVSRLREAVSALDEATPGTDAGMALVVMLDDSFTRAALRIGSDSFRPSRSTIEKMVALVEEEAQERSVAADPAS